MVFPDAKKLRSFTNSIPGVTKVPTGSANSGQHFAGPTEARAICCLAGYGRALILGTREYTSCDDNTMAFWLRPRNNFLILNACTGNLYISNLACAGALAGGRGRRLHARSYGFATP